MKIKFILYTVLFFLQISMGQMNPNFEVCGKKYSNSTKINGKIINLDESENRFYNTALKELSKNIKLPAGQKEKIIYSFIIYDRIIYARFYIDSLSNTNKLTDFSNALRCFEKSIYLNEMNEKKGIQYSIIKKLPDGKIIKITNEEEGEFEQYYDKIVESYKELNEENKLVEISNEIIDHIKRLRTLDFYDDLDKARRVELEAVMPFKSIYPLKTNTFIKTSCTEFSDRYLPKIKNLNLSIDTLILKIDKRTTKLDSLKKLADNVWIKLFKNQKIILEYSALNNNSVLLKSKNIELKRKMETLKEKLKNDITELSQPIYLLNKKLYSERIKEYNKNIDKYDVLYNDYEKVAEEYNKLDWIYNFRKAFSNNGKRAEYTLSNINDLKKRLKNLEINIPLYKSYLLKPSFKNIKTEIQSFISIHDNRIAELKKSLADFEKSNLLRTNIYNNQFNSIASFDLDNCKKIRDEFDSQYDIVYENYDQIIYKTDFYKQLVEFETMIKNHGKPSQSDKSAYTQKDYSKGLWSYTIERLDKDNSYINENTGEYQLSDSSKEYRVSLYMDNEYILQGNLYIEDKGMSDDDGYYEYYIISFGNYSHNYTSATNEKNEIRKIIIDFLRGKYSATRYNF